MTNAFECCLVFNSSFVMDVTGRIILPCVRLNLILRTKNKKWRRFLCPFRNNICGRAVSFHTTSEDFQIRSISRNLSTNEVLGNQQVLPTQTQVVICGAGTVGNSVAYHLVQNGWNDVLVLEQAK